MRDAPLLAARVTIESAELVDVIALRRGDGLKALRGDRVDCVVMAGMSGELMVDVVTRDAGQLPDALILQPNKDVELVRGWARRHGYHLRDERLSVDKARFYPVLALRRGTGPDPAYEGLPLPDDALELLGPHLVRRRDDALRGLCVMQVERLGEFVRDDAHPRARERRMWMDALRLLGSGRAG